MRTVIVMTILKSIMSVVSSDPLRCAVIDGTDYYSYRQVSAVSEQIAHRLESMGVSSDDVVAMWADTSVEVLLCLVALMRVGCLWVQLHPDESAVNNLRIIEAAKVTCLLHDRTHTGSAGMIRSEVASVWQFVAIEKITESTREEVPQAPTRMADASPAVDRVAVIMSSSGTTGTPKLVPTAVSDLGRGVEILRARIGQCRATWLIMTPLTYRESVTAVKLLAVGATVVLLRRYTPRGVMDAIATFKVTHTMMPSMALRQVLVLAEGGSGQGDLSSLKMLEVGGAPVSATDLRRAVDVFGPCVSQRYGQVEIGAIACLDAASIAQAASGVNSSRLLSCGVPCEGVSVAIMDANKHLLAPGERGEVVVKHSDMSTVRRMWLRSLQCSVSDDGWWHTGDIGWMDSSGYLYLVDRAADTIISGGHNICPADVETVISELPFVKECAVFGVPHDVLGEAIMAVVVVSAITGGTDSLIRGQCQRRLASYQCPLIVEEIASLPKTVNGKIDRKWLRREHWKDREREIN